MTYSAYVFDLDGTLLDTAPDLVRLTNMVLERKGWPQRTSDEVLSFVGNGGRELLRKAAPEGTPSEEVDDAFATWRELYPTYGHALTAPYDGIVEALGQLQANGAKLGVLSNKFDAAAQKVIADHFPGMFDVVRGECDEIPRKPNPRGLQFLLEQMGAEPARTAYVGDSGTDMTVALAVGATPIGVSWGYRSTEELCGAGAVCVVDDPRALTLL